MSRTLAEVDAEMEKLRAAGMHPAKREMCLLRAERDAILNPAPPKPPDMPNPIDTMPGFEAADIGRGDPEWNFIERCIERLELANDGNQTRLAKNLYMRVKTQLRIWRTLRVIVEDVGPGGEWPEWKDLGLHESTGLPIQAQVAAPVPARVPEVVIPPQGAGVTIEEMRKIMREEAMAAADPLNQMKRGIASQVAAQVTTRPEPVRQPVGAPV